MNGGRTIKSFALLLLLLLPAASAYGQATTPYYWPMADYDTANTNHSPQNILTSHNVQNLQIQWIYQVPINPFNIPGAAPSLGIETTPLDVGGILYFATPYNKLIALNSATGAMVWSYQVNMSTFVDNPWWAKAYVISTLSYYNGTIYMMASDTSVYAFDAQTGQVQFEISNVGANIPGNTGYYYGEKAPLVYKNELIVRVSTTDYGGRGFVAAYDLSSKTLLWRWYSLPPAGGDPNWDVNATKGNVQPYPGDWGSTGLIGGGAAWGTMTIDDKSGLLYFSTGHPSGGYDASLRPGPNLYADSIIALNVKDGQMAWYYQINPHDITEHEGGWSITLANITVNGQQHEAIIQAAKNNYVYVLDAKTGSPIYPAIGVGQPSLNSLNDNAGSQANLTASQSALVGKRICPGPDGGVEMSPALDGNILFVAAQNACGTMYAGPVSYKGATLNGYVYNGDPTARQNSTLYAIDLSKPGVTWKFEMSNRYQGSSAVVSGGVVFVVDRGGFLYALDEVTGSLLREINLGGLGASGVSVASDVRGDLMVYVPAGGGDLPTPTPGVVLGLGLVTQGGSSPSQNLLGQELPVVGLGVVVVALSIYIILQRARRRSTQERS
ncbi:MAG: PQQ-binding-like beta-propeller repeat protein [Thaumarchaeota archaeon]|nr:PQQ-binding-like beta-propeller repeat protein [Nitrososphaerota archaeon]